MDEPDFDLRGTLGLLRRRGRLILLTVILVLAAATVAIFALKPTYTASTLIMVDTSHKNILDPNTQLSDSGSDSSRVDSEVELVKSETTLLHVIEDTNLVNDPEFGVKLGLRNSIMAYFHIGNPTIPSGDEALRSVLVSLRDAVSVQRRGLTFLIAIEAKSQNPATAALLANALAKAYIRDQVQAKIDSTLAARDIIKSRIADANAAVVASENLVDGFIADNIDVIAADTGKPELLDLRRQSDASIADATRLLASVNTAEQGISSKDWQSVAESLRSDAVTTLEKQRATLMQSLTGAVQGSPQAVDLRAELAKIETSLAATAKAELTTMRAQISGATAKGADLRNQLRADVLASSLPASMLANFYGLQQEAATARSQYQTLLARQKELDGQAYLQVADSRIVSQAVPPDAPSFPNPKLIFALAGLSGLALGVGLAFLYENFVGGFTSEAQAASVLKIPVVTAIAKQRPPKPALGGAVPASLADLIVNAPLSIFAESVRRVRVGIDQAVLRRRSIAAQPEPAGTVIMVTSAAPNEGKTTLALSLARAYALAGRSTLLIDCDLRKPSVHKQLGIEPSSGFLEFLANSSLPLGEVLTADVVSGAQIIIGARRSELATDQLISGTSFESLVDGAKNRFHVVILDTPPIGPVVDGLYLAKYADVVAFVVRSSNTSQQDVKGAVAALSLSIQPNVEILAVLNQQVRALSSYDSKYSGYYTEP